MRKEKKNIIFLVVTLLTAFLLTSCGSESVVVRSSETESAQETTEEASEAADTKEDTETGAADETEAADTICVFVCGAVANEGVYELPAGARVNDALSMAGGFSEDAARDVMNLAAYIEDGWKLYFPTEEEAADPAFDETSLISSETGQMQDVQTADAKININTASKEDLMTLSGIGEAKAESILAYREANGAFATIEDIMNVSGIGESLFGNIKNKICVE